MNNMLAGIIGSVLTAIAIGIGAAILKWLRRRVKVTGPNTETIEEQARQLAIQQALVFMLCNLAKPQLVALLGILEALKEKMNGGFERAYEGIRTALDHFDETFQKIARGDCAEKKVI